MSSPSSPVKGSLLSRLAPLATSSSPSSIHSSGANLTPSPATSSRIRTRGARNSKHSQPNPTLSTSPPTNTIGNFQGAVPSGASKGSTQAVRSKPVSTTSPPNPVASSSVNRPPPSSDIGASRWASSPPSSPPLGNNKSKPSSMPAANSISHKQQLEAESNQDPASTEGSTAEANAAPTKDNSESLLAIENMMAKLRTSPITQKTASTAPTSSARTPPAQNKMTAPSTTQKKPILGGRSMWADHDDDDAHTVVPEAYRNLVVEKPKAPTVPTSAAAPRPIQVQPSAPDTSTRPPPIVSLPASRSPPVVRIPLQPASPPPPIALARPSTPPPSNPNSEITIPTTPATPSHLNWADEYEDDGDLPDLEDDWLIGNTETAPTDASPPTSSTSIPSAGKEDPQTGKREPLTADTIGWRVAAKNNDRDLNQPLAHAQAINESTTRHNSDRSGQGTSSLSEREHPQSVPSSRGRGRGGRRGAGRDAMMEARNSTLNPRQTAPPSNRRDTSSGSPRKSQAGAATGPPPHSHRSPVKANQTAPPPPVPKVLKPAVELKPSANLFGRLSGLTTTSKDSTARTTTK